MVCNMIAFTEDGIKRAGCVTDVINHDDGTQSYEVLADKKIHYLKADQFTVTRQASQQNVQQWKPVPKWGDSTLEHLQKAASRADGELRKKIEELMETIK